MAKQSKKFRPFNNWIYLLIVIVITGLIVWYFLSWDKVKETEKYMDSYLLSTSTITLELKGIKETNQVLQESPQDFFVYIGYTGDKDIYKLEKKLKTVIDDYGLQDIFYYDNITDIKDNENFLSDLNDAFNTTQITNVPCILYYEQGTLEKVIVKSDGIFNVKEFTNLLKDLEYEKKAN